MEAAEVLAWRGANLEGRFNGYTALHAAAMMNSTGMVRMLVEAGADIDTIDDAGWNAVHWAARKGNVEMLRLLRAAGSWLHTGDVFGFTALHCAVAADSAPAVEEILSWSEAKLNAVGERRLTPLHLAAHLGFLRIAELLVDAGADVNAVVEEAPGVQSTVLRLAAVSDHPEIVQFLLKAGAEVDPSGDLLLEAAREGCEGAVKVLLQARNLPEKVKAVAGDLVRRKGDL
jgi:ankyrin repeat protein